MHRHIDHPIKGGVPIVRFVARASQAGNRGDRRRPSRVQITNETETFQIFTFNDRIDVHCDSVIIVRGQYIIYV